MSTVVPVLPPPLREGDRLTGEEFLRRWEAMRISSAPNSWRVSSRCLLPLATRIAFHALLTAWLMGYRIGTPGCEAGSLGTWLMTPNTIPQPDLTLRWLRMVGNRGPSKAIPQERLN